ncbi:hypothetical protein [Pseudomonas trivialis]|nr:hypothetical protein [Pseudomonas trivialis]
MPGTTRRLTYGSKRIARRLTYGSKRIARPLIKHFRSPGDDVRRS